MRIMPIVAPLIAGSLLMGANAGCPVNERETVAEQRERVQTQTLTAQASTQVGVPAVTRFTEKRNLKMIYEKRDDAKLATVAYIVDLNGRLHKVCDALGYGFPYSTQFTSPHRAIDPQFHDTAMADQPEPNGLYMPSSADGTWILCLDPGSKDIQPVYVEPRVIVSPFALKAE